MFRNFRPRQNILAPLPVKPARKLQPRGDHFINFVPHERFLIAIRHGFVTTSADVLPRVRQQNGAVRKVVLTAGTFELLPHDRFVELLNGLLERIQSFFANLLDGVKLVARTFVAEDFLELVRIAIALEQFRVFQAGADSASFRIVHDDPGKVKCVKLHVGSFLRLPYFETEFLVRS